MAKEPYQEVTIEYADKRPKTVVHLNTNEAIELVKWFDEENTSKKTIYGKSIISVVREAIVAIYCREVVDFDWEAVNKTDDEYSPMVGSNIYY